MKSWDWWVPYIGFAIGWLGNYFLTRKSQSFHELTEVKNAYKMRVEEVEKQLKQLTPQVRKLEAEVSKFKGYHDSCQQALAFANQKTEELMKFFKEHVNDKSSNGLETDGPIS